MSQRQANEKVPIVPGVLPVPGFLGLESFLGHGSFGGNAFDSRGDSTVRVVLEAHPD